MLTLFVTAGAVWATGCGDDGGQGMPMDDAGSGPMIDAGSIDPIEVGEVTPSLKSIVKFKGSTRLRNDFSRALDLELTEVCSELGQFDCAEFVHRVPLGGTAAFDLGLYRPLANTTLTSPLAVERVAMAACVNRVERDFAVLAGESPGPALIFSGLDVDDVGALRDVEADSVAAAIDTLYKRGLQRRVSVSEIAHLKGLYRDIVEAGSAQSARDWAVLSCFAVMTTMEQLFY